MTEIWVGFNQLMNANDRAIGMGSQAAQQVLAEAENEETQYNEDVTDPKVFNRPEDYTLGAGNNISHANTGSSKKRKKRDDDIQEVCSKMRSFETLLANWMTQPLVVSDPINEKLPLIDSALRSVDGITVEEIWKGHRLFSDKNKKHAVLIFFGMDPRFRLDWLRAMAGSM